MFKVIPASLAKQLIQNYKTKKVRISKGSKESKEKVVDDTRCVWFSREDLLEALNIKEPVPNREITGVRFYFARYESTKEHKHPEEYCWKTTLVYVPTGNEELESTTSGGRPVYKDKISADDRNAAPCYPKSVAPYNDGQLCPPPPVKSGSSREAPKVTLSDLGLFNKVKA